MWTDTQRRGHVKIEAEIGAMQPQAEECLGTFQKLEEARKISPLEASEGVQPLDLRLKTSRTMGE